MASALSTMQIRAAVRLDSTGSWYRVLAGPFTTREDAVTAQETLARAGYTDTQVSQIATDTP